MHDPSGKKNVVDISPGYDPKIRDEREEIPATAAPVEQAVRYELPYRESNPELRGESAIC